jgi:hypothetical protein
VASVPDLPAALDTWRALGIDRGRALTASRPTPAGLLSWEIAVRDDGQRLFDGCLPTLIQWGAVHPASSLPASGLRLRQLALTHPQAEPLKQALDALPLQGVSLASAAPCLRAELDTPLGPVTLTSTH